MIKGVGIDIIEIDRVAKAVKALGDKFLNRIYTKSELACCIFRDRTKFPELAARFAAKEAYSKALGTGISQIRWKEIEVLNDSSGKPHLKIRGKISRKIHVSLSHGQEYAVASVVIEK